ncbi:hypothetical protein [Massilia sp. DD77]|uniref:hypothetical protein n=1 Tax=Massilia sp. DD77 TaxID=3109349 RepID=UPI003000282C
MAIYTEQPVRLKKHFTALVASWFGVFFLISQLLIPAVPVMASVGGACAIAIAAGAGTVFLVKEASHSTMKKVWMCSLVLNAGLAIMQFSRIYNMVHSTP